MRLVPYCAKRCCETVLYLATDHNAGQVVLLETALWFSTNLLTYNLLTEKSYEEI